MSLRIKARGRGEGRCGIFRGEFCLEVNEPLASARFGFKARARHEFICFILLILALPLSPLYRRGNEAQRGQVTCLRAHSTRVAELGFKGGGQADRETSAGIYRWKVLLAGNPPEAPRDQSLLSPIWASKTLGNDLPQGLCTYYPHFLGHHSPISLYGCLIIGSRFREPPP